IIAEWAFKEIVNTFSFLNYYKNQKYLFWPIGVQFPVTILLHNAHICLHQSIEKGEENNEKELLVEDLLEPSTLVKYFYN
ncbi:hypothetical protein L873DRAFT_1693795, partial [Choiromyces venosus 120613-1]